MLQTLATLPQLLLLWQLLCPSKRHAKHWCPFKPACRPACLLLQWLTSPQMAAASCGSTSVVDR
jgi:hypothetical protein